MFHFNFNYNNIGYFGNFFAIAYLRQSPWAIPFQKHTFPRTFRWSRFYVRLGAF